MSNVHTKATVIILDGNDISEHCNGSNLARTGDSHDLTTYGKDSHVFGGGLKNGTAQISGFYDTSTSTGPRAVIEPLLATTVPFIRRVEGTGSGKPQDSVNVVVTSYTETSPVADYVTWSADLQLSDDVNTTAQ